MVLKASENPPAVWPEGESVRDFSGVWWVAHTKSRNEKALAWQLARKEIHYFLPMSTKVYTRKGRTFRSLLPLFSGYLFFCGDENQRVEVLQTNRVANLIEVKDQEGLVNDLLPIQQLLDEGVALKPHRYIEVGQRCKVVAGPLMGTEGVFIQKGQRSRLVLQVDILGQATSVEVEDDIIELVD